MYSLYLFPEEALQNQQECHRHRVPQPWPPELQSTSNPLSLKFTHSEVLQKYQWKTIESLFIPIKVLHFYISIGESNVGLSWGKLLLCNLGNRLLGHNTLHQRSCMVESKLHKEPLPLFFSLFFFLFPFCFCLVLQLGSSMSPNVYVAKIFVSIEAQFRVSFIPFPF